jgi:dihydroorotate dehydrogenase
VSHLYRAVGGKLPIIGVGGIFTAEDAYEKIKAGASAVQIYTGFV